MDDCALQKRRPDPYSPTPVLNSTSIFGRVSQDDRLDWAGAAAVVSTVSVGRVLGVLLLGEDDEELPQGAFNEA